MNGVTFSYPNVINNILMSVKQTKFPFGLFKVVYYANLGAARKQGMSSLYISIQMFQKF